MQVNLINYIRQDVRVPRSQGLLPVFEAISNSLDSDAEDRQVEGKIVVTIIRNPSELDGSPGVPTDIVVEDNGIGFNDENFQSFAEAFSERKLSMGGKGRGRFTYLKVFEYALVQSRFVSEDGSIAERTFRFDVNFKGREAILDAPSAGNTGTTVRLSKMSDFYVNDIPKSHDALVRRFVWHFLPRLLSLDQIEIYIVDEKRTLLAEYMRDEMFIDVTPDTFNVGRRDFKIDHLRIRPSGGGHHRLIMAAAGREVADGFNLIRELPTLSPASLPLEGQDGGFLYIALVQGEYLDEVVDPLRLSFQKDLDDVEIEENNEDAEQHDADLLGDPTSVGQVRKVALSLVEGLLAPFLRDALQARVTAISDYIRRDGMGYHFLLAEVEGVARDMRSTDDASIEAALHERAYREKKLRRNDVRKLLSSTPEQKNEESYFDRWQSILEDMTEIAKSELAEYVVHRRAIIDLMNDRLRASDGGKHPMEEAIHSVIFPRGKQTGEVAYEQQNLWLIDERLAFHEHLFSDISVGRISRGESDSKIRPDLAIFESGYASFHDGGTPPANLVLVELKRAARTDASRDDPVQAALDYIEELKSGRAYSEGKAVIDVDENAFTTVYILADFTRNFRRYLSARDFKQLPGGEAYTMFHSNSSSMFIAMSYRRMIDNAEMRNRIFFKKLGIV